MDDLDFSLFAEAAGEVAVEKRYAGPVERRRREAEVEAALLAETDPDYEIRLRERRATEIGPAGDFGESGKV